MIAITDISHPSPASGGELVASAAPLIRAKLRVVASGGLARVVCEQHFENKHTEPLHVTYSLPLPADAAVSGFAFRIGDQRITGEVDRRQAARERFEMAVADGHTAAILDEERSSLFTQELGNIPPGATVVAEITLDQRLAWTGEGEWEWRFPTTVMPRYLGAPGRVVDAGAVEQKISNSELSARVELELLVGDALVRPANSPSHALRAAATAAPRAQSVAGCWQPFGFAEERGVRLDRDVVVRWGVGAAEVGVALDVSRPASEQAIGENAFGLVTLVPPSVATGSVARDLIVLLDTSGSMEGEPLEQARRVVFALLDTLGEADQLELIEFSDRTRRWKRAPALIDAATKQAARAWLKALRASGGTEMGNAVLEALEPLRGDAQRQVVLATDGAIGFETELLKAVCRELPENSRLHTVGVGSAVNRSLTAPLARAGRGVEVIVGLGEDPERAARRLVERTTAPVLTGVEIGGSALLEHVPERLPDVFAGSPLLAAAKLRSGGGELLVKGMLPSGERWERRVPVPPTEPGTGIEPGTRTSPHAALYARERVEDLELELGRGGRAKAIDKAIETIGLEFGVATRMTSWVAVSEEPTVDSTKPSRRVRMPHELPHGVSVEGLGLRRGAGSLGPMTLAGAAGAAEEVVASSTMFSLERSLGGAPMGGRWARPRARIGGPPPPREPYDLEGTILVANEMVVVIAITVASELEWEPGTLVCFDWEKEGYVGRIVAERSTAPGTILPGQTVRIYIELVDPKPPGDPTTASVELKSRDQLRARLSRTR